MANLTRIDIGNAAQPGKVFAAPAEPPRTGVAGPTVMDLLVRDFHEACSDEVVGYMGHIVPKAADALDKAKAAGAFGHASDAKNVTRVISAAFALAR